MRNILGKLYRFSSSWTGTIIIVLLVIFFVAQAFIIPSASMQNSLLIGDFLFAKKFSYGVPIPRIPFTNSPILPDFKGNGHLIEGERPLRGDIVIFLNPTNTQENFVKRCFAIGGDEVIFADREFYLHHNEGDEYIRQNFSDDKIVSIDGKLWVKNPYMEQHGGIHYNDESNTMFNMLLWESNPFANNKLPMEKRKFSELRSIEQNFRTFTYRNPIIADDFRAANITIGDFNAFYYKVPEDNFFMIGDNRDNSSDSRFFGSVPYSLVVGKPWFIYFSWDANRVPRWDRIGSSIDTVEQNINPKWAE